MRLLESAPLLLAGLFACAAPDAATTDFADLSTEVSVKPGINESWKSDEIDPLIGRLEGESREIYAQQALIAAVVGPAKGAEIADVGAGSGFMSHLFAGLVGPEGTVFAVDINGALLDHVQEGARAKGLENIESVVCTEKSAELAAESVDMVFICDTYHHFEYPMNTMSSIHSALRPGGQLVVVEFKRIPGVSRDFIMGHVRAGQSVFQAEIEAAGFELIGEHPLEGLQENYILRFRKI
ncbi:MAG: putative methyltransferase [Candidatus Paceibacteria bacterium]|jgi:predicted methyltransferase